MVQTLASAMSTFVIAYVVTFVALVALFKICIGKVMKLLGADIYTFNLKKRLTIISIISLVIAVIVMLCSF